MVGFVFSAREPATCFPFEGGDAWEARAWTCCDRGADRRCARGGARRHHPRRCAPMCSSFTATSRWNGSRNRARIGVPLDEAVGVARRGDLDAMRADPMRTVSSSTPRRCSMPTCRAKWPPLRLAQLEGFAARRRSCCRAGSRRGNVGEAIRVARPLQASSLSGRFRACPRIKDEAMIAAFHPRSVCGRRLRRTEESRVEPRVQTESFLRAPMSAAASACSAARFVAETLMPLVLELERAYARRKADPAFARRDGRLPGSITSAARARSISPSGSAASRRSENLSETRRAEPHRLAQGQQLLGQILLARRMGKSRIIAETGAGQHGVATATYAPASACPASSSWAPPTSSGNSPTCSA